MLRALLAKDLRRAWRNPLPWVIFIALPLCITALIGLVFGGKSDEGALGRIRFAVVDEDDSLLTGALRGAMNQRGAGRHLEPVFMDREAALREITDNKLSAAVIIPTNFTHDYFTGQKAVRLELIKNPAESIHPAALEELLGVVVTGLNAVARNFQSEFPAVRAAFKGKVDQHKIAALIENIGNRVEAVKQYLIPPLVTYERGVGDSESQTTKADERSNSASEKKATNPKNRMISGIFAWALMGMVAMFLLFLASNAMNDLQRELRFRTFERYQTLREQLLPFVAGKVLFGVVFLLLCSAVMIGGGGFIFQVRWEQPLALATLTLGYTCFAAGLMAALVALAPDERRASTLNSAAVVLFGMAGACMFPRQWLPPIVGDHLTPLLPSFWFVDAARTLQSGSADVPWGWVSLKLVGLSCVLIALAVAVFRRRFASGSRA